MNYTCACCGEVHEDLPDLAFDRPTYAHQIPEEEYSDRVSLTSDLCIIDDESFFIRGLIEIPVLGQEKTFGIGVWVSQKEENFRTYERQFDSADIGPFFGWLSNEFRFMGESTLSLKTMAHFQGNDLRPSIALEPTDHPLAVAQKQGISLDQAWEFIHDYLDPSAS